MFAKPALLRACLARMRTPRIKIETRSSEAVYHCISRTNNGERCIDDEAKEVLRSQIWQVAEYCGVQILTHVIMDNHFHVLVRVPVKSEVGDAELLRRYRVLHPRPSAARAALMGRVGEQIKQGGGPDIAAWRKQQRALMGDVSRFMKMLKQNFAAWFNRTRGRSGVFWCERFRSVLVEGRGKALAMTAAYIDLNPVRVGAVSDPKDYRFCGYAEAVAGAKNARAGIMAVVAGEAGGVWSRAHEAYRKWLFGADAGAGKAASAVAAPTPAALKKVLAEKGTLPLPSVLRCRVKQFSHGSVLGSEAFVSRHLANYRRVTGCRKKTPVRPLPQIADWGDVVTLRGARKKAIG